MMRAIDVNNVRWVMYLKNGKIIVENHDKGRTWKKCYKNNYGNIEAVCIQIIPKAERHFVTPSPTGEYWTFEDMSVISGQARPTHIARNLCSMQYVNIEEQESYWSVLTIYGDGNVKESIKTGSEINYESLTFVNREEKNWI
jgi:hypothetical protein